MATRILILAANPKDTDSLRLGEEVDKIKEGLRRSRCWKDYQVEHYHAPTPTSIRRALLDFEPDIVHFCGHGAGDIGLAFEKEDGNSHLISGEALSGLFKLFSDNVKCVILNACYSEAQANSIVEHIESVIGMKKEIGDEAAIEFAVAIYDALGAGKNIEFAFELGCVALQMANIPEHLTPILKKKDGRSAGNSVVKAEVIERKKAGCTLKNNIEKNKESRAFSPSQISDNYMLSGFLITLLASFFWGLGNTITRWSMAKLPNASYEITFVKYISASCFLFAVGFAIRKISSNKGEIFPSLKSINLNYFLLAALAKGLSMYFWLLAVTQSNASLVAALENMHVVWTALILFLLMKNAPVKKWITSSLVITLGVVMISGQINNESEINYLAILFGALSGLGFSIFGILWTEKHTQSEELWERTIGMGFLLLIASLIVFPIHMLLSYFLLEKSFDFFNGIAGLDISVQAINGLIGIGVTYFLINESLSYIKKANVLSSLFLGLGLSFAVPITMVSECFLLNVEVKTYQWIGLLLFLIGYSYIRSDLFRINKKT
ncbi:EamA family transporter [Pseudoalteromonas sp. NC201]|uniref:EamA family transporter n=1 Tax=Pseudoalteromonas sp. NC201 TaxID=1514074 RepID=UPI000C7DD61D|nr:CHAT domain-containing protein [Pseudoalteromonas sp. NC201]AUJ69331.1 CHAT domain protein [Pseudoalteromonas sp. NC201]